MGLLKFALRLVTLLAVLVGALVTVSPAYAAPGPCDGTPASDPLITCSTDPTPDDQVGLGLGDDTYVQNAGVTSDYVGGDADENGLNSTGNGGNDHITINGIVTSCVDGDNVDGDGGNDTIIINGEVHCDVSGDYASGNGGNDSIVINGEVYSSVFGDLVLLNGGDDTITINGIVGGDVYGDAADNDGGNDTIIINGTVAGDVYADAVYGAGGNDRVELGAGSSVGGLIDGEDGFDTLVFKFLLQSQLDGLDPANGFLTHNGQTYTWANFESLLGTLITTLQDAFADLLFAGSGFMAADMGDGIRVYRGDTLVAFAPHVTLRTLAEGDEPLRFQADGQEWYITVVNLGPSTEQPYRESLQVKIVSPAGDVAAEFIFLEK